MKLDNFPETMKARIRKRLDKKEIWPYPSRLCGDHKWYERALECERQGMNRFYGLEIFRKSLTVFQCIFLGFKRWPYHPRDGETWKSQRWILEASDGSLGKNGEFQTIIGAFTF